MVQARDLGARQLWIVEGRLKILIRILAISTFLYNHASLERPPC